MIGLPLNDMGMVILRNYGRMGNFLFQAAATMGYAWRHGMAYTMPNSTLRACHNPIYLQHLVNPKFDSRLPQVVIEEKSHAYQELPFEEKWRVGNIVLDGYWQSEKYFSEFRLRLLEAWGFPWKPMPGFISVHVRRGDYLRLTEKHPPVPKLWIDTAMEQFPGYHFIFFSDEIGWCQREYGRRRDVTCSVGQNVEHDLALMSGCEHHICSASTYSWWGAWLNHSLCKRILIPKFWFMPGRPEDTKDIIPEGWEKI